MLLELVAICGAEFDLRASGEALHEATTTLRGAKGSISGSELDRGAWRDAPKEDTRAVAAARLRSPLQPPAACSRLYRLRTASSLLPGIRAAILHH